MLFFHGEDAHQAAIQPVCLCVYLPFPLHVLTQAFCVLQRAQRPQRAPPKLLAISQQRPRFAATLGTPMGRHKDDVHAVGVMGVLFLSTER